MQWLIVIAVIACQLGMFFCVFSVGRLLERRIAWHKGFERGESAWREACNSAALHEQYLREREARFEEHVKSLDELAASLEQQRIEQESRQAAMDERHACQLAFQSHLLEVEARLIKQPDLMRICYQPSMN